MAATRTTSHDRACALSGEVLTASAGVSRRQLLRWLHSPQFAAFQERYREYQRRYADQVFTSGLARREVRVAEPENLCQQILSVVTERGEQYAGEAPGAGTGLLARGAKVIGDQVHFVYKFDRVLVQSIIEVLREIADELGHRVQKQEISGSRESAVVEALHEGRKRVAEWRARQGADDASGKRTADDKAAPPC